MEHIPDSPRAPSPTAHLPGSPEEQEGWRLRQLAGCCWWGRWPFYKPLSSRCPNSLWNKPGSTCISTSRVFTGSLPYLFTWDCVSSSPVWAGSSPACRVWTPWKALSPQQDGVQHGALASSCVDFESEAVSTGTSGNRCQRVTEAEF